MSDKEFQKALIHLYTNIDQYGSYSAAIFEPFALSSSQKQQLDELMTSQRQGLLLFNQQLHDKRRRSIRHALAASHEIAADHLETLLDAYAHCPLSEGARDPADAVRFFADFASAQIDSRTHVSRELEFIRFEAVFAALLMRSAPTTGDAQQPRQLSANLRLSLDGDAALIASTYDVLAVMTNPSSQGISDRPVKPCWCFLFQTRSGEVRILTVAPGLARVLRMLQNGRALGDVWQVLASEAEKAAAGTSLEKLLRMGAPFVSFDPPVDHIHHPSE